MKASALLLGLCALYGRSSAQPQASGSTPAPGGWNHQDNGNDWEGVGQCGHNERQSPIDISEDFATPINDRLVVKWDVSPDSDLQMENLGDTWNIFFSGSAGQRGTLKWNGYTYNLAQVHCHAASEHTWEGAGRDIECHFVHVEETGKKMFAVTGITFAASHLISSEVKPNAWLQAHIDGSKRSATKGQKTTVRFPVEAGMSVDSVVDFTDAGDIVTEPHNLFRMARPIPANDVAGTSDVKDPRVQQALSSWRDFFHYKGSLTTPPCTQAVSWFVQRRAILVPREQAKEAFDLFQKDYQLADGSIVEKGNFRETQNEQNAQELYKVRMDWTAATASEDRKDPVLTNKQLEEVQQAKTSQMCADTVEEVEDWKIIIAVIIPTIFLAFLIVSLFVFHQYRTAKNADRKLAAKTADVEAPHHGGRQVVTAGSHMAEMPEVDETVVLERGQAQAVGTRRRSLGQ